MHTIRYPRGKYDAGWEGVHGFRVSKSGNDRGFGFIWRPDPTITSLRGKPGERGSCTSGRGDVPVFLNVSFSINRQNSFYPQFSSITIIDDFRSKSQKLIWQRNISLIEIREKLVVGFVIDL